MAHKKERCVTEAKRWPKAANAALLTTLDNLGEIIHLADAGDGMAECRNIDAVRRVLARIARLGVEAKAELNAVKSKEEKA